MPQNTDIPPAQKAKLEWKTIFETDPSIMQKMDPRKRKVVDRIMNMFDMLPADETANVARLVGALRRVTGTGDVAQPGDPNLQNPWANLPENPTPEQMYAATGGPPGSMFGDNFPYEKFKEQK